MRATGILVVTTAVLLTVSGCGGDGAEERLEEASQELAAVRESVEQARQEVADRQDAVEASQAELEAARDVLRAAEQQLLEIEARVDLSATDAVLFRSIQKRLLEDDKLENVAIAARVEKGIVSLSGDVPTVELRERALEIARTTPGAGSVQSQIRVQAQVSAGD